MNRRSFFKFLGIGAATAAVAPKMLADTPMMSGTPINKVPYVPTTWTCNSYPTYADYSRSVTVDIGTERMLGVTEQRYSDMIEQLVLTLDKQLRLDAGL